MPKRERSGAMISPARVVAPISVNLIQLIGMNARAGALADDQIDAKILHRGVENFFEGGLQAMDFVEEKEIARVERGEDGGEIALFLEQRAGADFDGRAHFVGENLREGGFAEARRAVEQDMVERFAAVARGFDGDLEIFLYAGLADEVAESLWADAGVDARVFVERFAGDDAVAVVGHGAWWLILPQGLKPLAVRIVIVGAEAPTP